MYYDLNYRYTAITFTKAQVDLMNHIRMLWEQHGVWTRSTITSLVFDLPNSEPVIERLLRNPKDFERALQKYYGQNIALKFSELLEEHLVVAAELVKAAKIGDDSAALKAERKWYNNADSIANFLGDINPYWLRDYWKKMMYDHLALVKAEAVAMLTGKYNESVDLYDKIEIQALQMADVMADGIIKQFDII